MPLTSLLQTTVGKRQCTCATCIAPCCEAGPRVAAQSCPDVAAPSQRGAQDQQIPWSDSKSPRGGGFVSLPHLSWQCRAGKARR